MDMDWRQKRIVQFLTTILVMLVIAVLLVGGMRWRQYREAVAEAPAVVAPTEEEEIQHPYTALRYDNGSFTLSFAVDEATGRWQWADDPAFPLDASVVSEICGILATLQPQQTLVPEEDLSEYNLSQPVAYLAATEYDGDVLTIQFGKTTTDEQSFYTLINYDTETLYIIDGAIREKMAVAIYDMMVLPEFPVLTEATIQSLSVHGTLFTALEARHDGDETTWQAGGVDATDSHSLANVLADLPLIKIEKCIDYNPSDEAAEICGFTPPAALLKADYITASGEEKSASLAVGTKTLDGSGYYACVNGEPTIYQVSPECVDALLAMAEAGLVS